MTVGEPLGEPVWREPAAVVLDHEDELPFASARRTATR